MRSISAWLTVGVLMTTSIVLTENGSRPAFAQTATTEDRTVAAEQLLQQCRADLQAQQFEAALQSCQQSATAHQEIGNREGEARSLMNVVNVGVAHNSLQQYQQALEWYQQALIIAREVNNRDVEALALRNLGLVYYSLNQYSQAIEYYQQVLPIHQEAGDRNNEVDVLAKIASIYLTTSQYRQAIETAQQVLILARELKDRTLEAVALGLLSGAYQDLGQYRQSAEAAQEALVIAREMNNRGLMALLLGLLGKNTVFLGQFQQAIQFSQEAVTIAREIGNPGAEALGLIGLGSAYRGLGQYRQAIQTLEPALVIAQQNKDQIAETLTIVELGATYSSLGENEQATDFFNQALALAQQTDNVGYKAVVFSNLSIAYNQSAQYSEAIEMAQQALTIARELGSLSYEAYALSTLGQSYSGLGQLQQAVDNWQQALAIYEEIGDPGLITRTSVALGLAYLQLDQKEQSIAALQQGFDIAQQYDDRQGKGIALIGLGFVYGLQNQNQQALEAWKQASEIFQETGDRQREAFMLGLAGTLYNRAGQPEQAMEVLQQALITARETGLSEVEAWILVEMGETLLVQNQPQLAIVFYKQSINLYESIRGQIRPLPLEFQQSYTEKIDDTYRKLADLLLQQDRIFEAQRVLDLLKVQELEDYLHDVRGNEQTQPGIANRAPETQVQEGANAILDRAIELGKELSQLEAIPRDQRNPEQQTRVEQLRQQQQTITQEFLDFLGSEQVQSIIAQLRQNTDGQGLDLTNITALQDNLRNLRQDAVLLYPFVLENRLELVLVTPDAPPIRKTVSVPREALNRAIVNFRNALKDPTSDAITPAQQLYQLLIQPIEDQLAAAGAKTIIYAPDGALRYIPLAALHDGNEWLAQRFRINNITAVSLTELNTIPTRTPAVFAGAFTEGSYPVRVGNRQQTFAGLEFAGREVENLAALIPDTTERLNQAFNLDTILEMNDYTIVHLATHAAFVPNSPDESFILFGDGKPVTLREIKTWRLSNVDLVVLSACETGLGDELGDGREILGLGYQIQRTGARAALASLWQVSDGGTQILMNAFYRALENGMTKAEALRQAQIALITEDLTAIGAPRGATIEVLSKETGLPITVSDNLNHPYYWAPFILIGNGL